MSITYPITQRSIITLSTFGSQCDDGIYIVGTGSSLADFDFDRLKDKYTIALNDAVKHVPRPDILFHADGIHDRYKDLYLSAWPTAVVTQRVSVSAYQRHKKCSFTKQLYYYIETEEIHSSTNCNAQLYRGRPNSNGHTVATPAIHLAWKLGARRIFLLGVDCYCKNSGQAKEEYYLNGKNPSSTIHKYKEVAISSAGGGGNINHEQERHSAWIDDMAVLRKYFDEIGAYQDSYPGSNIFNLSADSGITAWEKVNVDEML